MAQKPPPTYLIVGASIAIALAVGFWVASFRSAEPGSAGPSEQTDPAREAQEAPADGHPRLAAAAEAQRRREAEAAQGRAAALGKQTLETLDAAETEQRRWTKDVEPLLTDGTGQKIASDPDLVSAFRAAYEKPRSSAGDLAEAKGRVTSLLGGVTEALGRSDSFYVPSPNLVKQLEAEKKKAEQDLAALATARTSIEAISKQASTLAASSETLAAAIAQQKSDAAARFAKEEGERVRAAEEAAARRATDEKIKQIEAAADRKVLEMKASDPTIQARYQPFLARGVFSGKRANNPQTWRHYEAWQYPAPISLGAITQAGALTHSETFIAIACGLGRFPNDRPKWPKPESMERAQEYAQRMEEFRELAPIWLEMKLLSQ